MDLEKIHFRDDLLNIMKQRISSVKICFEDGAYLSIIIMIGGLVEGILLSMSRIMPMEFNRALSSPKDRDGKTKHISQWTLNNLIDVSYEIRIIDDCIKKFSHYLRDYRNFLHPLQQLESGFSPNKHTNEICIKVLEAVIQQVAQYKESMNN